MKICIVQTRPLKGDIQTNIENHKKLIAQGVAQGAQIVVFPELSLTGYEPSLAKELATVPGDTRFDVLQKLSDDWEVTIGVGVPLKVNGGIGIGMVLFQPDLNRQVYLKKYIHADEEPFFISGRNDNDLIISNSKVAPAICYELSVPAHSENAFNKGAEIYIASVAKTSNGVGKAMDTLSEIAHKYSMIVLMANCTGVCDGEMCAGQSAIWNRDGTLLAQLNKTDEGFLMIDTDTVEALEQYFKS